MKNLYLMRKAMLGAFGMTLAMSGPLAQTNKATENTLNTKHNAGAAKASKPVFESDGTPANDAALGKSPAKSVMLPDRPTVKPHGKHTVSLGPVGPQEYPSTAQQEVKELR